MNGTTTEKALGELMLNTRHHLIRKEHHLGGIAGLVSDKTEKIFGQKIHVVDEEEALMEILTPL